MKKIINPPEPKVEVEVLEDLMLSDSEAILPESPKIPSLLHCTSKQLVFETAHLIGKSFTVSVNKGAPIKVDVKDDVSIVTCTVPDSFSLTLEIV